MLVLVLFFSHCVCELVCRGGGVCLKCFYIHEFFCFVFNVRPQLFLPSV